MRRSFNILFFSGLLLSLQLFSCGQKKAEAVTEEDVLVSVGDSVLTIQEVVDRIPSGLNADDSIAMYNRIIEEWVKNNVLESYAEKNIRDLERINRLAEDYRNSLIINEYLQTMEENSRKMVSEERIKKFYEANKSSMVLEQPIVKGVYLKVSESDESLPNLRKWLSTFDEKAIDHIEKSGLRQALQYRYFNDEWVEWSSIAEQIPYRFFDADAFLKSTSYFETSDGGSVYLLKIADYVPSSEEMPYEFARRKISDILQKADMSAYRANLIKDIYRRQIKEGILKPGLYNPLNP